MEELTETKKRIIVSLEGHFGYILTTLLFIKDI